MIEYILGGKTIRVPEDKVDDFLSKYPDAKIKESIGFDLLDPNFQEDTVESADAVSEKTPVREDMVSVSEDTSSDLPSDETFQIDGEVVTKEEFDDYTEKQKNKEKAITSFSEKLLVDFKKGSTTLGEMIASVPETIYDLFALPQNLLANATGLDIEASAEKFKEKTGLENPVLEFYEAESAKLQESQDIYNKANYDHQGIYKNFKEGNFTDGFKQLASGLAESAPVSMSMMIGGATVGIGRLASGSTIAFAGPEIKEQREKNLGQSEAENIIKGLGLAGAESVFSSIGTGTIGKVYKDILIKEGKEEGVKVFRQGLVDMYKSALTKFGAPISMIGEGIEEVATTVTQNMINGVDPFKNVTDSFIQGVGGGFTYGSPVNAVNAVAAVNSGITNLKINKEIKAANLLNISEVFDPETKTSEAEIKISQIPGSIEVLKNKLNNSVKDGSMSKQKALEVEKRAIEVQGAASRIKPLKLRDENQANIVDLMVEKRNLQNTVETVNDKSLTEKESKRIEDINTEMSDVVVEDNLTKTTKSVEGIVEGLEGISIKNLPDQEAVDKFKKDNNIPISKNKDAIEQGFIYQNPETGDQTIIINEDASKRTYAVNVAAHEFLHGLIYQTVKNSPESAISLGESLNEYINGIDRDQVKNSSFKGRLESYEKMDEATQSEEVLTLFSDALATGDISFNENVFTKIGDVIRRTMQKLGVNIKFNSGKDVYKFIKDYNKSIEKGKLTKSQAKLVKGKAKGSLVSDEVSKAKTTSKKSLASLQEQLDNLDELDFDFDMFAFEAAKTNLKKKIELAKKKEAEPKKETKEKPKKKVNEKLIGDQFKEMVPEGTTNSEYKSKIVPKVIRKIEDDRMLFPLVKKIAAGYNIVADNVYGKSWDDFYDAVVGVQLKKNILNFKPESNDDLGGYIIGGQAGVRNRVKEALEKFRKEESKATEDIDKAADLTAEEKTSKQEARKKYTSIINSNVVPSFTTKAITEKLVGIVSDLKSKVTDKPGVNAASTPFIKEIKSKVGKVVGDKTAIPKLIRERMGKFTKDQKTYEQFLIKNKKAILENMTTTWLITSIPNAVEKSVGGKYTGEFDVINIAGKEAKYEVFKPNYVPYSEWKGAKIDREGGAKRGITSGNELARRVPASRISDQDFVDALIIKSDNKKTQSKFESLSKALAEEISFEIISRELKIDNSQLKNTIEKRQTELGVDVQKNLKQEFDRQAERGLVKFSLAERKALEGASLEVINLVEKHLNIKLTQKNVNNALNNIEREINDNAKFEDLDKQYFTPFIEIKKAAQKLSWVDSEETVLNTIVELSKKVESLEATQFKVNKDPNKLDVAFNLNGLSILLEVKKNVDARLGTLYIHDYTTKNKKISNYRVDEQYSKSITEADKSGDELINWINKNYPNQLVVEKNEKNRFVYTMPKSVYLAAKKRKVLSKSRNVTTLPISLVTNMYNLKNGYIINFSDVGAFSMGDNKTGVELSSIEQIDEKTGKIIDVDVDIYWRINNRSDVIPVRNKKYEVIPNRFTNTISLSRVAVPRLTNRSKEVLSKTKSLNFNNEMQAEALLTSVKPSLGQKAINNAVKYSYAQNPKGISVWDFDDTLARTKSNVLYTMPDGTKGKLDAAQFAAKSEELSEQGAQFDFSEFSKVMKGKKGPMFDKAIKRNKKFGNKNVYILTARPADSKYAIHEFLKGIGLDIRLENIVGLADGNPQAKASWMIGKVAEGYNDFYFADDHLANVKAVKQVLDNFDVKGKVQQAKIKFSKSLDKDFNDMLERNKGVSSTKEFSPVVAKRMAKNKSMFKFWMPASLDDFRGLTQYVFAGKGKQGEADQKFFQDALITPYFRGIKAIEDSRQTFKDDFKALNRAYKPVLKKLGKLIPNGDYTYDQAIRVMLWKKSGYDIPGLSKKDEKNLVDFVESQPDLLEYVLLLQRISKRPKWAKPEAFWDAQTILSDLNNMTEKGGRKEYISEFIENVDIIFSEKNLLKIKALYGEAQVSALKDIIWRMKNGTNRTSGMNKNVNRFNNWVNNSIGAIMFFNRRSALLQTLSTVNFINWSDNNMIKAGAAFANQPQFWKDFAMIFNSAKLKQRRSGLKSDVNEAEIASAVKGSKNKATAALSYLLKKGFLPTQMVDSFAIASGGASFYRNRVNTYLKQGMELAAAEKQAFEDFSQISEETQQSGDPALISSDQASALGRLLLAFQNTPIQLNRSIKKAALDIKNRRRSPGQTMVQSDFSNLSKIIYYGAIQNIIFSALQNALFALIPGFGDDDDELTEEEQKEKYGKVVSTKQGRIINGISDTLLKGGFGVPGAFISTAKNMYMEYNKQEKKEFLADHTYTILAGANLAPPVGSKLRKIYSAIQTNRFEKDVIKKRGWDVTIDGKFNLSPSYRVLGSFTEGATNLPLDRIVSEVDAITEALDSRNTTWQRLALAMGWKTWDVSAKNEEHDLIKTKAKAVRKKEGIEKAKKTRNENNKKIKQLFNKLSLGDKNRYKRKRKDLNVKERIKYLEKLNNARIKRIKNK